MLVLDAGRMVVRTELQPPEVSLEDATQMEMEERLYDRLHVECSETQVLFCDSGEPEPRPVRTRSHNGARVTTGRTNKRRVRSRR